MCKECEPGSQGDRVGVAEILRPQKPRPQDDSGLRMTNRMEYRHKEGISTGSFGNMTETF